MSCADAPPLDSPAVPEGTRALLYVAWRSRGYAWQSFLLRIRDGKFCAFGAKFLFWESNHTEPHRILCRRHTFLILDMILYFALDGDYAIQSHESKPHNVRP